MMENRKELNLDEMANAAGGFQYERPKVRLNDFEIRCPFCGAAEKGAQLLQGLQKESAGTYTCKKCGKAFQPTADGKPFDFSGFAKI